MKEIESVCLQILRLRTAAPREVCCIKLVHHFFKLVQSHGKGCRIKLCHIVSDLKSESLSDSVYYMRSMDIVYFVFVFRVCRRAGLTNLV